MPAVKETVKQVGDIGVEKYKFGWSTDLETEKAPIGLSEDTIRFISHKKDEPKWMLDWRLEAYQRFQTMKQPNWAKVDYPDINFNDMYFYSAPKDIDGPASLEDVDPELLKTYDKLGIPLLEQEMLAGVKKNIAVDAVFDSVSVVTTFKDKLAEVGIIFCSISEAIREHPDLVQKYISSVVPKSEKEVPPASSTSTFKKWLDNPQLIAANDPADPLPVVIPFPISS